MVDTVPRARHEPILNLPPMTAALLIANVLVHGIRMLLPGEVDDTVISLLGFLPGNYLSGHGLTWYALVAPVTYQFLHGGWMHLGINMLGLVAFGSGAEQQMGRWRFLVFYLLCGVAGAAAQFAIDPASLDPLIGASAAISGAFGAILRLQVFRRSFWLIVGVWLVMNTVAGVTGVGSEGVPVAWVAHLGGFFCGLILFPLFRHAVPPGIPARYDIGNR